MHCCGPIVAATRRRPGPGWGGRMAESCSTDKRPDRESGQTKKPRAQAGRGFLAARLRARGRGVRVISSLVHTLTEMAAPRRLFILCSRVRKNRGGFQVACVYTTSTENAGRADPSPEIRKSEFRPMNGAPAPFKPQGEAILQRALSSTSPLGRGRKSRSDFRVRGPRSPLAPEFVRGRRGVLVGDDGIYGSTGSETP